MKFSYLRFFLLLFLEEIEPHFSWMTIPEVSWFGHYIREWKNFPSLLEAWGHFWGIEVTFLGDCISLHTIPQICNLQFILLIVLNFYKKLLPPGIEPGSVWSEVLCSTNWATEAIVVKVWNLEVYILQFRFLQYKSQWLAFNQYGFIRNCY